MSRAAPYRPASPMLAALAVSVSACVSASLCMAADVPHLRLTIPAGAARQEPGGTVRILGPATTLVRVRGLAVLIDPADEATGAAPREVDVVVLSRPWATQAAAWSATPVVTTAEMAQHLRAQGYRSVYPLQTWEGITIRKGDARLRLTSMPDAYGMRPAAMAALLDFGPSCRILVHQAALSREEIGLLPQRFPGAVLALLQREDAPLLLSLEGREPAAWRPAAPGEPYRFGRPACN